MSFWTILLSFGVFHGVFLMSVLLSRPAENAQARAFLLGLVLSVSLIVTEALYAMHGGWMRTPQLIFVTSPLWFVLAPLLYGFVDRRVHGPHSPALRWRDALHLLPALTMVAVIFIPFWTSTTEQRIAVVTQPASGWRFVLFHVTVIVQWLCYLAAAGRLAWRSASPRYLRGLLVTMGLYLAAAGPAYLLPGTWIGAWLGTIDYIFILTLLVHVIAWVAVRDPGALFDIPANPEKYRHSTLSETSVASLIERLDAVMQDQKPYRDPSLTLDRLADLVDASSHHVSQCLNQGLDVNFYGYINRFRVDEARRRLHDPANGHLTILAVAEDSGFNSKASFNRAFRKMTGMSPSEFKASAST